MLLLELGWHGGKNLLLANQPSLLQERKRPFKTGKWSLMIFKQTLIKLSTKNWKDLGSYKDLCPICDFSSCPWYREVVNYHRVEFINLFVYLCFSHIAKNKNKILSYQKTIKTSLTFFFSKFIKHCLSAEWKSKNLLYATYKQLRWLFILTYMIKNKSLSSIWFSKSSSVKVYEKGLPTWKRKIPKYF